MRTGRAYRLIGAHGAPYSTESIRCDISLLKRFPTGIYLSRDQQRVDAIKKSPANMAGQKNGTSLGLLIPYGSLREASEPAPGYSAFDKKIKLVVSHIP